MTVRLTKDTITPSIARMRAALERLPALSYLEWIKQTPIDTGNARRKTRLNRMTILAQYPYAERLNEGASKQAPKGMSEPVKQYIESEIRKIMRL